jgi:hypothetical protein
MEGSQIRHQFYKKPMASRKLVQAKSAFSTGKKRSILLEEGMSRLRNCSPELSWSRKAVFLNRFSSDLINSGHTASFRRTVLNRIVKRYQAELSNHLEGRKPLYRSREERESSKDASRIVSQKETWFRAEEATSTLTVPSSPDGLLAEKVRKNILQGRQLCGTKTKEVENGGKSSNGVLIKSNQFPKDECG